MLRLAKSSEHCEKVDFIKKLAKVHEISNIQDSGEAQNMSTVSNKYSRVILRLLEVIWVPVCTPKDPL